MKVTFKVTKHRFDWKAAIGWAALLAGIYFLFK